MADRRLARKTNVDKPHSSKRGFTAHWKGSGLSPCKRAITHACRLFGRETRQCHTKPCAARGQREGVARSRLTTSGPAQLAGTKAKACDAISTSPPPKGPSAAASSFDFGLVALPETPNFTLKVALVCPDRRLSCKKRGCNPTNQWPLPSSTSHIGRAGTMTSLPLCE